MSKKKKMKKFKITICASKQRNFLKTCIAYEKRNGDFFWEDIKVS